MIRLRAAIILCLSFWGATADAQTSGGINWSYQAKEGVAFARKTRQPMMFWIVGRTCCEGDRIKNRELKAFRDSRVLELARNFVTVRLSRSANADLLKSWNLSTKTDLAIVFSTPDGKRLDMLHASAIVDPEALARKMQAVLKSYRNKLFRDEIETVLVDPQAKPGDVVDALELIERLALTQADKPLIDLLDRQSPDADTRGKTLATLAKLSTPAAVDYLLKAAREEDAAVEALKECTPVAAERLLSAVKSDYADLLPVVYEASAHICGLRSVKPRRFWEGENKFVLDKEFERVRKLVAEQAERWRKQHAELR